MVVFGVEYWGIEDIARECGGVHRVTVHNWMKTHPFPPARIKQGRSRYWDPKEILEFYRVTFVQPQMRRAA